MRFFLAIVCYLRTERYAKNSRTFSVSQSEYVQFSEFCLEGYKSEHGEGTNHPICNFSEIFAAVELLKKICLPSHLRKRVLMCSHIIIHVHIRTRTVSPVGNFLSCRCSSACDQKSN